MPYSKQKEHELLNRLIGHAKARVVKSKLSFTIHEIHAGKLRLRCKGPNFEEKGYWFVEMEDGLLSISHGDTQKDLFILAKDYFKQF